MRSVGQPLAVIASIVLILMTIGCGVPAGSQPALEQSLVTDPADESSQPGEITSGASTNRSFGGAGEIDDPFAVIGSAFSGLGFQSYSSGCDPFEDTYGTCL